MAKKETEVPQRQSKDQPNSVGHWALRLVHWMPITKMAEMQAEVDTLSPPRDALSLLVAGLSMVAFHGGGGGVFRSLAMKELLHLPNRGRGIGMSLRTLSL